MQGEAFMLKFRFEPQYPISSPAVQFVVDAQRQAPVHPVRVIF
jgi:ubiquitin-conjugating enzyme E2 W